MKINRRTRTEQALSVVEIIVIIAACMFVALVVLAALMLPALARAKAKSARINCVSNLKQIGLGFRLYSNDNGENFPWKVAPPHGTKHLTGWSLEHFRICSNEFNTPRILACNSDSGKTRALRWEELTEQNISYFVGFDADETRPQTILSGDRNIEGGTMTAGNVMLISSGTATWGKGLHNRAGNMGLGDGSAMQLSEAYLRRQLQAAEESTGNRSTRLAMPPTK